MVAMLLREEQEKWVYQVMSGRKGMLAWKLSRSKIPVSEKKLEKKKLEVENYKRACGERDMRQKKK